AHPVRGVRLVAAIVAEATAPAAPLAVKVLSQRLIRVPGDVPAHRVVVVYWHEGMAAERRRVARDHGVEGHHEDVAPPPVETRLEGRASRPTDDAGVGEVGLISQRRVRTAAKDEFANTARLEPSLIHGAVKDGRMGRVDPALNRLDEVA